MNLLNKLLPKKGVFTGFFGLTLSKYLDGFWDGIFKPAIEAMDQIILDQFAETTTKLTEWETANGLLEKSGNRTILKNRMKSTGGNGSPRYIQDYLQGQGFDVYVHEWWDPYTLETRDPRAFLSLTTGAQYKWQMGRLSAQFDGKKTLGAYTTGPNFLLKDGANTITNGETPTIVGTATYNGYEVTPTSSSYNVFLENMVYDKDTNPVSVSAFLEYGSGIEIGINDEAVSNELRAVTVSGSGRVALALFSVGMTIELKPSGSFTKPLFVLISIENDNVNVFLNTDLAHETVDELRLVYSENLPSTGLSGLASAYLRTFQPWEFSKFTAWNKAVTIPDAQAWYDIGPITDPLRAGVNTQFDAIQSSLGYALVNKPTNEIYTLPSDPKYFPYFAYIGGQTFPDIARVPKARKEEFERLLLTLFPTRLWIGVLVNYDPPPENFIALEDGGLLELETGGLLGLED